jgi:hypothetical protein
MIGDVDVQDSSAAQFHQNEHIKDAESGRHYDEEVTSHNGLSVIAYLPTLRGETRMPSFSFNSLAIRSCPQVEFSAAIWRINPWRSFGRRGFPTGRDFHRHKKRNPLRCHRISVSGLTTTKAMRQSNHRLRKAHEPAGGIVGPAGFSLALLKQRKLLAQK